MVATGFSAEPSPVSSLPAGDTYHVAASAVAEETAMTKQKNTADVLPIILYTSFSLASLSSILTPSAGIRPSGSSPTLSM